MKSIFGVLFLILGFVLVIVSEPLAIVYHLWLLIDMLQTNQTVELVDVLSLFLGYFLWAFGLGITGMVSFFIGQVLVFGSLRR